MRSTSVKYERVLLKLSGESFTGERGFGTDSGAVSYMAQQIKNICELGVETAIVVGGGNILRGLGS